MAMPEPRWLDEDELHAWRSLQLMQLQLTATLGRELAREGGLSYQDYLVLVAVTGQAGGRMRAFELGRVLGWEKSRVSHHVSRMAERGYVTKERCASDQRGAYIVVTRRGRKAIEAAAPGHVEGVRRHFVDHVTGEELAVIRAVADRVLLHLDEHCEAQGE